MKQFCLALEETTVADPELLRPQDSDSSLVLLGRARAGDRDAVSQLVRRYLPALRRWAHGRLPHYARATADTDDLIQVTLMRALARLEHFDPRHAGAFPAYLRQALLNGIRDEIRKAKRRSGRTGLSETVADPQPTPLETAVGRDILNRYERALNRLSEDHRAAVVLRHEMGLAYEEVGQLLGGRSANAARLLVVRAVKALAIEMNRG